uniref:Uncharacterized protein n=1 Tax=Oryzias latipes TaxID=8090 RepID=A0A3P9J3A2_ORYLA
GVLGLMCGAIFPPNMSAAQTGFQLGTFPSLLRSLMWAELSPRQEVGRRCVQEKPHLCSLRLRWSAYLFPQRSQMYCFPPECTCLWCVRRWLPWLKLLSQRSQAYGFSPVCTRTCSFRLLALLKVLLQELQANGRSVECVRFCSRLKRRPHTSQLCGFSPACVEKLLPQSEHWKGRSPLCVHMWLCMLCLWRKARPQTLQANGFSPVWIRKWDFRLL